MAIQQSLAHQVAAYNDWKDQLKREIKHYQHWLEDNHLASDDADQRLARGLSLLREDQLTLAFVGEYSRGKTELINALVFAEFGQRMLPSQAGRTTMCPTEVFYDAARAESYLRLLPIETRVQDKSIFEYKNEPDAWHEIPIDVTNPEQMSFSMRQVALTRSASIAEARTLGFDESMLEKAPGKVNRVIIPVWRHALISLDSPMLKQGLRVLDTPGLNALGSEPELTISMIPKAQAVIFVLSADTGVTASDMTIWTGYIQTDEADHRAGRFAVLNKIDVLWDDLQGDKHTASSIERVRQLTADQLQIDVDDVIPLSAKQGLIGRVKKDDLLLQKSALLKLERLISKRILGQKETLIYEQLIDDVVSLLLSSQAILNERLAKLYERYDELTGSHVSTDVLQRLADKTQQEHDRYYKKLLALKSSRRLVQAQGEILQQLISAERFDKILAQTKSNLRQSWSTLGLNRAMSQFFLQLEQAIEELSKEATLADKMVHTLYQRFIVDTQAPQLKPKTFSIAKQRQLLDELKLKSIRFRRDPKMIMTEQSQLIQRFINTFVEEARVEHRRILDASIRWSDEALLPLMQYTLEQKKLLETQVAGLKKLASTTKDNKAQQQHLKMMIDQTGAQLAQAEHIQQQLSLPPPSQRPTAPF